MTDIINQLAGISTGDNLDAMRDLRPDAKENAEVTFRALLEPADDTALSYGERYAVAAFVAGVFQVDTAADFYLDLLGDAADETVIAATRRAIAKGRGRGPLHQVGYVSFQDIKGLGERLAAAFDFAHLLVFHPVDAHPAALGHLEQAGLDADGIVSLAQLVSFLSFQVRVVHGLRVLNGAASSEKAEDACTAGGQADTASHGVADPGWELFGDVRIPDVHAPEGFVNHSLGWKPWIPAVGKDAMTQAQIDSLIKRERIDNEYFRLLARDPEALKARTKTDLDIFYNTNGGMGRAERELAATVVSRFNGCVYCASVHQARCVKEGGDREVVDRLLDEGVEADVGSPSWAAIRDAAVALTRTPIAFSGEHVAALRDAGADDVVVIDAINSASFFNWANRLMLTLGEPDVPKRFRN